MSLPFPEEGRNEEVTSPSIVIREEKIVVASDMADRQPQTFGLSDSDDSNNSPTQLAHEEAVIDLEMRKLEERKALLQAKRDAKYCQFLSDTKMPTANTPDSGGSSTESKKPSDSDSKKKRKAQSHDLREKFANRTTLGRAPGWPAGPSPRKPSPIRAPSANEQRKKPPVVKGEKFDELRLDADKMFTAASKSLAKMVDQLMTEDGMKVREDEFANFGFVGQKRPNIVPQTMPHEKNLEALVLPEKLQAGEWDATWQKWGGPVNENITLSAALPTIFDGLKALHSKVDLLKDIMHLHSVAHIHVLKASYITRLFCVADAPDKQAVTAKLVSSLRSIILASDPELKHLPFKELGVLTDYFKSGTRVEKLAIFALHYVDYGKGYNKSLLNMLLSPDLQNKAYWHGADGYQL